MSSSPIADAVPWELLQQMKLLWQLPADGSKPASTDPFKNLVQTCHRLYNLPKGFGMEIAMESALRSLGAPALLGSERQGLAGGVAEAARRLHTAFILGSAHKTYLCPLDLADNLPPIKFGPAEIRTFSRNELESLFGQSILRRWGASRELDYERLCRFTWLVVRESYKPFAHPGSRAFPFFEETMDRPIGWVQPHKAKYPALIEDVLLLLLLAPWEDCAISIPFEWRPFRIPWFYTVDDDPFVSPPLSPNVNALTWTYHAYTGHDGDEIDIEAPEILGLEESKIDATISGLTDVAWEMLQKAKHSTLFNGPLRHFLTHAFSVGEIDEFLAHMLVIEAGLGLPTDFPLPKARRPAGVAPKRSAGGKVSIQKRLIGLLSDLRAADIFDNLYEERSAYLHGRDMQAGISGESCVEARRLARRVAGELMIASINASPQTTRDAFLGQWTP